MVDRGQRDRLRREGALAAAALVGGQELGGERRPDELERGAVRLVTHGRVAELEIEPLHLVAQGVPGRDRHGGAGGWVGCPPRGAPRGGPTGDPALGCPRGPPPPPPGPEPRGRGGG